MMVTEKQLFTRHETWIVHDETTSEDTEIEVEVTNDTINDPDHEYITIGYFSPRRCRSIERDYYAEDVPDAQYIEACIKSLIAKSEDLGIFDLFCNVWKKSDADE